MNKEIINTFKKELAYLVLSLILSIILFKIIFYKESILTIFKTITALFAIFIFPGYCLLLYWYKELHFFERFIIGFAVGTGINGMLGYYLGVWGINLKYSVFIIPILIILISLIILKFSKAKIEDKEETKNKIITETKTKTKEKTENETKTD